MTTASSNSWRTICLLIMVSFISISSLSYQSDTILPGQSIKINQTITSQGGIFELGFFPPYGDAEEYYVGIWYKSNPSYFQVWTANTDTPISSPDNGANLILTREGDLQLQVNGRVIWNTGTTTTDLNTTKAVLLDSGNLIVGSDSSTHKWESFNYPTDTWLPGAKIGLDITTGKTDPLILTAGNYSFGIDPSGSSELLIWDYENKTTARIGASDFSEMNLESKPNIIFNVNRTYGANYATYHTPKNSTLTNMILDSDGQLRLYIWNEERDYWLNLWTRPNGCSSHAPCGGNGICFMNQSPVCVCPIGFQPNYTSNFELRDYFAGCVRRNGSECLKDKDEFIALPSIRMPLNYEMRSLESAELCRLACAANCSCSAYSYMLESEYCNLWSGDLLGMEQQDYAWDGGTVFLRSSSNELPKKGENPTG